MDRQFRGRAARAATATVALEHEVAQLPPCRCVPAVEPLAFMPGEVVPSPVALPLLRLVGGSSAPRRDLLLLRRLVGASVLALLGKAVGASARVAALGKGALARLSALDAGAAIEAVTDRLASLAEPLALPLVPAFPAVEHQAPVRPLAHSISNVASGAERCSLLKRNPIAAPRSAGAATCESAFGAVVT